MSGNTPTKFIILTSQRSGSAWLVSMLNKLNGVSAYSELFLNRKRKIGEKKWDSDFARPRFLESKPSGLAVRPFSVFSYLDQVFSESGVVGFKLMYSQLQAHPEILLYVMRHRVRVVHLIRRNHLNVEISRALVRARDQAHAVTNEGEPELVRVTLDPETLIGRLKDLRRNINLIRRFLRVFRLNHIEIAYEDLATDAAVFSEIFGWLGLDHRGDVPESNLVQIRRGGHADVLLNYDEIRQALSGTRFANLLD